MKNRDEILNLLPNELSGKLTELQEEMANLKLQQATHQITNPLRIRLVRRDIAPIETIQSEYDKGIRSTNKSEKE